MFICRHQKVQRVSNVCRCKKKIVISVICRHQKSKSIQHHRHQKSKNIHHLQASKDKECPTLAGLHNLTCSQNLCLRWKLWNCCRNLEKTVGYLLVTEVTELSLACLSIQTQENNMRREIMGRHFCWSGQIQTLSRAFSFT